MKEDELRKELGKAVGRKKLTPFEETLLSCMTKGGCFYHSGLDQRLKTIVENKFSNGIIEYLFATPGLALPGVNFSNKDSGVRQDTSF